MIELELLLLAFLQLWHTRAELNFVDSVVKIENVNIDARSALR